MSGNALTVDEHIRDSIKGFSFPLNAYAWCLVEETGTVNHLHYGLFSDPEDSVEIAQQRATDYLFSLLPEPCEVLEVGVGLGTTLKRLLQLGYKAVGITPEAAQASLARQVCTQPEAVVLSRFETFEDVSARWELILFQESSQYIDPVDLFGKCSASLKPNGEIILLDEFSLVRDESSRPSLHFIEHFTALGERFGFELLHHADLSRQAALTVDCLLRMLNQHKASLVKALKITADRIGALIAANESYKENYLKGRFGYRALKFRRTGAQTRLPRWIRPGDAAAVRSLFSTAFEKTMSQALWNWKYAEDRGQAIGVWDGDKLLAHYGGVSRRVSYFGKEVLASQSADVMTRIEARRSLTKRSPLFTAAATFLEGTVGFGGRHLLGFGFPNERARLAPERLGLYSTPVGKMFELSWDLNQLRWSRFLFRCTRLNQHHKHDLLAINHCWHLMKKTVGDLIIGVRDASWLTHRYWNHPEHCYELYSIKFRTQSLPFAVVVLRRHADESTEWMDAVSAPSRMKWLIAGMQNIRDKPISRLFAWASDPLVALLPPGSETRDLNVGIPANAWTPGPSAATMQGKWWLMGGDTDFR